MKKIIFIFLTFTMFFLLESCAPPVPDEVNPDGVNDDEAARAEREKRRAERRAERERRERERDGASRPGPGHVPELDIPAPDPKAAAQIQTKVKYVCDGNKAYVLSEGDEVSNPECLCELDALHANGWCAKNESDYCRRTLADRILKYNCVPE